MKVHLKPPILGVFLNIRYLKNIKFWCILATGGHWRIYLSVHQFTYSQRQPSLFRYVCVITTTTSGTNPNKFPYLSIAARKPPAKSGWEMRKVQYWGKPIQLYLKLLAVKILKVQGGDSGHSLSPISTSSRSWHHGGSQLTAKRHYISQIGMEKGDPSLRHKPAAGFWLTIKLKSDL